jgi:hypothetical protein
MKTILLRILCLFLSIAAVQTKAQSLDSLNRYRNSNVFYSPGFEQRSAKIESYVSDAINYYAAEVNFKPEVTVLVLSEKDWSRYTSMPVYGMPHYTGNKTLIVAASDNAMWKAFIPDLKQLPEALATKIKETYTTDNGTLTMESFFDLLALHELGHAFHLQGGLNVQRKWMGELFCNIFLHTYVAERAPQLLGPLTIFPQMVVSGGADQFTYKTLAEFEQHYATIGSKHPRNYGWYQCRLHAAAKTIYDASGKKAFHRLWQTLKSPEKIADDSEFAEVLREKVAPSVSDVFFKW